MNISRNPAIAYQQGRKDGEAISKAADIERGINFTYAHMLIAMYNANIYGERAFLSKPKLAKFYTGFVKELERQLFGAIEGEAGLDTYDITDLYMAHDREVRERLGLPLKNYDGKDGVL